jgi:hypothetical protein
MRRNVERSGRILNQLLFGGSSPFGELRTGSLTGELFLSEAEGGQARLHGVEVKLNANPFPFRLQF